MEKYSLLYTVKAVDEFDRHFEAVAKIDANHLIIKEMADPLYLQMMVALLTHILLQMGSAASAEWSVEVDEELDVI